MELFQKSSTYYYSFMALETPRLVSLTTRRCSYARKHGVVAKDYPAAQQQNSR